MSARHIVYEANYNSYVDILAKKNSFTIYQGNIESLAIELFKVKRNLQNAIIWNVLKSRTLTYS